MARSRKQPTVEFDPYRILDTLERARVSYVVIGAFARVIHGTGETTRGIDITPSMRIDNIARLQKALASLEAAGADGQPFVVERGSGPIVALATMAGELKLVPTPEGSRGYDDLRRHASRENIGHGLRPQVATPADLSRMLTSLGREHDAQKLAQIRRVIELERRRGLRLER